MFIIPAFPVSRIELHVLVPAATPMVEGNIILIKPVLVNGLVGVIWKL